MTYRGIVQDGVVVLSNGQALPDGTVVNIVPSFEQKPGSRKEDDRSIGQKLADLARQAETEPCDLPDDLAKNHDHYLHGLPKKE